MSIYINMEAFKQHYTDTISCKDDLNRYASQTSDESSRLEYLRELIYTYGHEMVKKVIANAVLNNKNTCSKDIITWAENARIELFMYESSSVLKKYIPDELDIASIEIIALNLIDREKQRESITSNDGLNLEVIQSNDQCYLLRYDNENKDTLYLVCQSSPAEISFNKWDNSPREENIYFRYQDALQLYNSYVKDNLVFSKLLKEYEQFRDGMLVCDAKDIFDNAFKIVSIEDLYFILTEDYKFTEFQKDYIINNEYSTLETLYEKWRDTDYHHNEEVKHTIDLFFGMELEQTNVHEIESNEELEI